MSDPVWIDEALVLAVHGRLLAIHGGAGGLRDDGLLKSALARPMQLSAYGENVDLIDMASAYAAGVVKNHPFVDGNKRTGFLACVLFLELNGFRFNASEEDAAEAVLALAAGTLDEPGFVAFLRGNVEAAG